MSPSAPPAAAPEGLGDPAARGITRVSPHVVERVAAYACHRADSVVTPRTDSDAPSATTPRARAEVSGRQARLSVSVGARYPASIAALAASVRRLVAEDVERLCGLSVVGVDVEAHPVNLARQRRVR